MSTKKETTKTAKLPFLRNIRAFVKENSRTSPSTPATPVANAQPGRESSGDRKAVASLNAIPDIVDYSPGIRRIRDQGGEGSVSAQALALALEYEIHKATKEDIAISARHIYYLARKMRGKTGIDSGASIADCVRVLSTEGAVEEDVWPYFPGQFAEAPPQELVKAERFFITQNERLEKGMEHTRRALANHGPLVGGATVFNSFTTTMVRESGLIPLPNDEEAPIGGTAVVFVGYDDKKRLLKFCNSWGQNWGDGGFGYLPYEYAEKYVSEVWIFKYKERVKTASEPRQGPVQAVRREAAEASLGWLHLSDLHQGLAGQKWLFPNLREKLFRDLEKLHEACGPWDVVFFTGDLTQNAGTEQFVALDKTLGRIWETLAKLGSTPLFLAVPGNHDLVRPTNPRDSRVKLLAQWGADQEIIAEFWNKPSGEYRTLVEGCFANYAHWAQSHPLPRPTTHHDGILPGDFSAAIEKDGKKFGVVGLNSAFLQLTGENFNGKLALGVSQFQAVCGDDAIDWTENHDFVFLLTHHPPVWLHPSAQQDLRGEISSPGRFAVHLYGHMHEGRCETVSIGGAAPWRNWQAPSLFGQELWGDSLVRTHGYTAGRLNVNASGQASLRLWPRVAVKTKEGVWQIGPDISFDLQADNGTASEPIRKRRTGTEDGPNM